MSSGKQTRKKGVFIVGAPRATTTTLFKIFSQVVEQNREKYPDAVLLLEPFSQPYYLELGGVCPGMSVQEELSKTFDEALDKLLSYENTGKFIIAKDLGCQLMKLLLPAYDNQLQRVIEMFDFLFLIRSPEKTIPSLFAPYYDANQPGDMRSEEVSCVQLQAVFNAVLSKSGKTPLVMEAEDYLTDPNRTLSAYFPAFGLEYHPSYITWEPLPKSSPGFPYFNLWSDTWYSVYRTSGLKIESKEDGEYVCKYPNSILNNSFLKALYEEHNPAYEDLRTRGARPSIL